MEKAQDLKSNSPSSSAQHPCGVKISEPQLPHIQNGDCDSHHLRNHSFVQYICTYSMTCHDTWYSRHVLKKKLGGTSLVVQSVRIMTEVTQHTNTHRYINTIFWSCILCLTFHQLRCSHTIKCFQTLISASGFHSVMWSHGGFTHSPLVGLSVADPQFFSYILISNAPLPRSLILSLAQSPRSEITRSK